MQMESFKTLTETESHLKMDECAQINVQISASNS